MVNAGRILIIPRGAWDNLTVYQMLDLITYDGIAYIAKQTSTGINPKTDPNKDAYWQTFGSAVVPDGETIVYDSNSDLAVNIDGTTLKYDSSTSFIKVAIDGVSLKYDSTNGVIYADVVSTLSGLSDVNLTNIQNGQIIAYNSTSQKFVNIDLPSGGGAKIKVTTSESTLYGQTVTLSDGTHTLVGTFNSSGEYTFEGVQMSGNLTVSSSDGSDTATRVLNVPYYGAYEINITFFSATVVVSYPSDAGATCTLSDGSTTLVGTGSPMSFVVPNAGNWTATVVLDGITKTGTVAVTTDGETKTLSIQYGTINVTYADGFRGLDITCTKGGTTITKTAPSVGNTMSFYPNETGEWIISGTYGGNPYTANVTITSLSTPETATLDVIPDGSTVTPVNDVSIWLQCAGISLGYTTISQVLADSTTLLALMSDDNAVDYLVRSTSWASDITGNSTAMTDIGANDYCAETLLSDSTWASAIANSTYFESVLNVKVPVMTSNTTPSGICDASSVYNDSYPAWKAFDGNISTFWNPADSDAYGSAYIGYTFIAPVVVRKFDFFVNSNRVTSVKVVGSNDSFTTETIIEDDISVDSAVFSYNLTNDDAYTSYKVVLKAGNLQVSANEVNTVQFYGRS